GIRDYKVTGVQTCASDLLLARQPGRQRVAGIGAFEVDFGGGALRRELEFFGSRLEQIRNDGNGLALARRLFRLGLRRRIDRPLRSEERRVGEEGRCGLAL